MLASAACWLALLGAAQAHAQGGSQTQAGQSVTPVSVPGVSATLEGCVTAPLQGERSATFSGEMTAIAGTARMSMRVDVEERMAGEEWFHTITATGLGVWRSADPKVKVYKYLKQVSNLAAPAVYRAIVSFRWLNAKGHLIKRVDRLTPRCAQLVTSSAPAGPQSSSGTSTTPAGSA
jgi:hypothetical protein